MGTQIYNHYTAMIFTLLALTYIMAQWQLE